jgi:large subunit ribosomal protein L25
MKSIKLTGTIREAVGKNSSKSLRAAEQVPCILYGGKNLVCFSVIEKDLKNIIYTPHVYVLDLDISGQSYTAKIQDIQFHPVTDKVNHIDFYELSDDKKIVIDLPVIVKGNSIGVREGGRLIQDRRKVKVKGLVKHIPDEIVIDVTDLVIGKSVKVSDLSVNNVEFLDMKNTPVVSVKVTRVSRAEEEAAATAAVTPAGAEAPAAGAAGAPAAGGKTAAPAGKGAAPAGKGAAPAGKGAAPAAKE